MSKRIPAISSWWSLGGHWAWFRWRLVVLLTYYLITNRVSVELSLQWITYSISANQNFAASTVAYDFDVVKIIQANAVSKTLPFLDDQRWEMLWCNSLLSKVAIEEICVGKHVRIACYLVFCSKKSFETHTCRRQHIREEKNIHACESRVFHFGLSIISPLIDDKCHFRRGGSRGVLTWEVTSLFEKWSLAFYYFPEFYFFTKSYKALLTNFTFPDLLPQNCHYLLKILAAPLVPANWSQSKSKVGSWCRVWLSN